MYFVSADMFQYMLYSQVTLSLLHITGDVHVRFINLKKKKLFNSISLKTGRLNET